MIFHFQSLRRLVVVCWLVLSWNSALQAADDVQLLKDVSYKPAAETEYERQRCKLDLYLPASDKKDFATIVWFHGGGLQGGDKGGEFAPQLGERFARDGIAVASVNYRLSPKVKFPAYIEDAAAAVAFVHAEIAKHGGDPHKVFVSGHSAGGYLTAMVGADEQYLAKHQLKLTDLAGLMPVAGQMITHSTVREERDIPRTQPIIDSAAPAFHANARTAPWLLIAGGNDLPARPEENRYFAAALKAAGHKDVTYLEVAGRSHGSIANQIPQTNDEVAKQMLEFMQRVTSKKE